MNVPQIPDGSAFSRFFRTFKKFPQFSQRFIKFQLADLDSIGIKENEPSVYETFIENIKHDGTHYEVNLPWKPSHLPDNFILSLGRLRSLTKRLQNSPKVFDDYNQIIVEQEQPGIIERVDIEHLKPRVGETNYLQHREVIKEDRTTTITRIVYDGSAKLRNSVSLSDRIPVRRFSHFCTTFCFVSKFSP